MLEVISKLLLLWLIDRVAVVGARELLLRERKRATTFSSATTAGVEWVGEGGVKHQSQQSHYHGRPVA